MVCGLAGKEAMPGYNGLLQPECLYTDLMSVCSSLNILVVQEHTLSLGSAMLRYIRQMVVDNGSYRVAEK